MSHLPLKSFLLGAAFVFLLWRASIEEEFGVSFIYFWNALIVLGSSAWMLWMEDLGADCKHQRKEFRKIANIKGDDAEELDFITYRSYCEDCDNWLEPQGFKVRGT